MEYVGSRNLFTSHFVIGAKETNKYSVKATTIEMETLHRWLDFKDSDWGMERYRQTQYVDFLWMIELDNFEEILTDLATIYKKQYPYSVKADFIEHTLNYTLSDLNAIISRDYIPCGNYFGHAFYYDYDTNEEVLDFAIPEHHTIEHYIQYYRKVIDLIENFDYSSPDNKPVNAESYTISNEGGPNTIERLILFNSSETIEKLRECLKVYFPNQEQTLAKALNGEQLNEPLLFPHNQNKFVEVFKRAKYNGRILSSPDEINNWLCTNFQFRYKKGDLVENRPFNKEYVTEIFSKAIKEPKDRICVDGAFLPYKNPSDRTK
jgi:hypothetical protein